MTGRRLVVVAAVLATTTAAAACTMEADRMADVRNATGRAVVIDQVTPQGHAFAGQTLAPGIDGFIGVSGKCQDHAGIRVRYQDGTLLGWRQHLCVSDHWVITADGAGLTRTPDG